MKSCIALALCLIASPTFANEDEIAFFINRTKREAVLITFADGRFSAKHCTNVDDQDLSDTSKLEFALQICPLVTSKPFNAADIEPRLPALKMLRTKTAYRIINSQSANRKHPNFPKWEANLLSLGRNSTAEMIFEEYVRSFRHFVVWDNADDTLDLIQELKLITGPIPVSIEKVSR